MTREEKLADGLYWYIHQYVDAMSGNSNLRKAADASRELDRALMKALRSKKK